jgi:DNA-binding CsgD family transcriptional regulator
MLHNLSPRELDCTKAMLTAKTYQKAADQLGIGRKTVDYHLSHARKKYKVSSTTKLLIRGMAEGWL